MAARAQAATARHQPAPWQLPYHRRVSGPAPTRQPARARRAASRQRLLTPIRAAIVGAAVLLLGVVLIQVEVLRVNSQLGKAIETRQSLERSVAALQAETSALSAPSRVASEAQRLGMVPVGEGAATFLDPSPAALAAALERLSGGAGGAEGGGIGGGP
jgi:cell division protein FtsL